MIYELRIYTTLPGRMPNLLSRFDNHTLRIWEKHGIKQVGFWYVAKSHSPFDGSTSNNTIPGSLESSC